MRGFIRFHITIYKCTICRYITSSIQYYNRYYGKWISCVLTSKGPWPSDTVSVIPVPPAHTSVPRLSALASSVLPPLSPPPTSHTFPLRSQFHNWPPEPPTHAYASHRPPARLYVEDTAVCLPGIDRLLVISLPRHLPVSGFSGVGTRRDILSRGERERRPGL